MLLALAIVGLFFLPAPWNVIAVAVAALIEVGEVYVWTRYLRRHRVRTGAEGLVGAKAEVIEACDPRGRVRFRGEIWHAHCDAGAAIGDRVEVTGVHGLTLRVEPAD